MKIFFSGAAGGDVTGSKHLLEINGKKILLDCGLFQGKRSDAYQKNRNLLFTPSELDAVIVSHAHLDHCGNLPTLTKNGYIGKIFMTQQTADIVPIMLEDSARIQEYDEKFVEKHLKNLSVPNEPLYTTRDIPAVTQKIVGKKYHEEFEVLNGVFCEFFHAGHILGSATVKISFEENGEKKTLLFTGDLGRKGKNLLPDPESPTSIDYLITESTYGNRVHDDVSQMRSDLQKVISEAARRGGKIIVPAFSLQRTQEFIYDLHILVQQNKIPKLPIYVDSPLATRVTEVYRKHRKEFDVETYSDFFVKGETPLYFDETTYTSSVDESKALKNLRGPAIIISASGMCEGGRIRHHLKNEISDERNTILFIGYQAQHTLGRRILERRPMVKIFDEYFRVRAHIKKLNGYSGHADYTELLEFIDGIEDIKTVFVVHGESGQSAEFAKKLRQQTNRNWTVEIPEPGDLIDPEEILW